MANQRATKGTNERNREEEGGKERQKVNEKAWFVRNARAVVRMKEKKYRNHWMETARKREKGKERDIDADT